MDSIANVLAFVSRALTLRFQTCKYTLLVPGIVYSQCPFNVYPQRLHRWSNACTHFPSLPTASTQMEQCKHTFPMSTHCVYTDWTMQAHISHVYPQRLHRWINASTHFPCLPTASTQMDQCKHTFPMSTHSVYTDGTMQAHISHVYPQRLHRWNNASTHFPCLPTASTQIDQCKHTFPMSTLSVYTDGAIHAHNSHFSTIWSVWHCSFAFSADHPS